MQAKVLLDSMAQQSPGRDQVPAAAQKTTALLLLNLLQEKSGAWLEQPWGPHVSAQYSPRRACLSPLYPSMN